MGRLKIPRWLVRKGLVPFVGLPLVLVVLGILIVPLVQRVRTSEANAAMVASPAPIDGRRAYGYLGQICEIGPRIGIGRRMCCQHPLQNSECEFAMANSLRSPVGLAEAATDGLSVAIALFELSAQFGAVPH